MIGTMDFRIDNIRLYFLAACLFSALSCSEEAWQAGKEDEGELILAAHVEKVMTRVTDAGWTGGETVAVMADGIVKPYIVDVAGNMTAGDQGAFRWKGKEFEMMAWYPVSDAEINLKDQSSQEKFFACDLLFSKAVATASRQVNFTFSHMMTRMQWTLAAEGYTEEEIRSAQVAFFGYGAVSYTGGNIVPSGSPDQAVSTFESQEGGLRRGQAMMVPCDMWGKPLVQVNIGGDSYTYIPDQNDEADFAARTGVLEAGCWQKYTLTVSRKMLTVSMQPNTVGWENGAIGEVTDAKLVADITPEVSALQDYIVSGVSGGLIADNTDGFSISYAETGLGGLLWEGTCQVSRSESGNTQTYTFSNVRSDIRVTYLSTIEPGYYFYDNGTWGPAPEMDGCTALGRVFALDQNENDESVYPMNRVRGYVVCTEYSDASQRAWVANPGDKDYLEALASITISEDQTERESDYSGYKRTNDIDGAFAGLSGTWETGAPFWYAFKNAGAEAPAGTSGWYIPTVAQLKDIHKSGYADGMIDLYWSSQLYAGTSDAGESHGIQDGTKTTIWSMRYYVGNSVIQYGWSSDPAKLLMVLTF